MSLKKIMEGLIIPLLGAAIIGGVTGYFHLEKRVSVLEIQYNTLSIVTQQSWHYPFYY